MNILGKVPQDQDFILGSNLLNKSCENPNCGSSVGLCGRRTFGHGNLGPAGYWEFPCYACARTWEKEQSRKDNAEGQPAWPRMVAKDFFHFCSKTEKFTLMVARLGSEIFLNKGPDTDFWVCAGYAILARRGLAEYSVISDSPEHLRFLYLIEIGFNDNNWSITVLPGEESEHVS